MAPVLKKAAVGKYSFWTSPASKCRLIGTISPPSLDGELFFTRMGASGKQGLEFPPVFSSQGLAS